MSAGVRDINWRDRQGRTELFVAVQKGKAAIVERFLRDGADPNLADNSGRTPLTIAVEHEATEIVCVLLAAESLCISWESMGRRLLETAARGGHMQTIELLTRRWINDSSNANRDDADSGASEVGPYLMTVLAKRDLSNIVRAYCIDQTTVNALINYELPIGWGYDHEVGAMTPLHFAVLMNDLGMVALLLGMGADVKHVDRHGRYPHEIALEHGYLQIVTLLKSCDTADVLRKQEALSRQLKQTAMVNKRVARVSMAMFRVFLATGIVVCLVAIGSSIHRLQTIRSAFLKAHIAPIQFYVGERVLDIAEPIANSASFDGCSTKAVYNRFRVEYLNSPPPNYCMIEYIWMHSDGSIIARGFLKDETWTDSLVSWYHYKIEYDTVCAWKAGVYTVILYAYGKELARSGFSIY